jgi:hypothetical protein
LKTKSTEGDAKVRGKVSRARALLSDAYREFGACTASLDEEGACTLASDSLARSNRNLVVLPSWLGPDGVFYIGYP